MNLTLRKEILQDLPKGAVVIYKMRRDAGTVLARKIRDHNTGMRIFMYGQEIFVHYRKLTCDEIIKSEEVTKRLTG